MVTPGGKREVQENRARLTIGDAAPEVVVFDSTGQALPLSETWKRGPIVLTFLRHFG